MRAIRDQVANARKQIKTKYKLKSGDGKTSVVNAGGGKAPATPKAYPKSSKRKNGAVSEDESEDDGSAKKVARKTIPRRGKSVGGKYEESDKDDEDVEDAGGAGVGEAEMDAFDTTGVDLNDGIAVPFADFNAEGPFDFGHGFDGPADTPAPSYVASSNGVELGNARPINTSSRRNRAGGLTARVMASATPSRKARLADAMRAAAYGNGEESGDDSDVSEYQGGFED